MYSIVELEEPPDSRSSEANAINNSGQIVVDASFSSGPPNRAFLWSEGVIQDLGELLFDTLETELERLINHAYAINNSGQVVGASGVHAFLWDASTGVQDLGTLPDYQRSEARAINDSGQVVGWSSTLAGDDRHAFLWDASTGMQDLGTLPDHQRSEAGAINNAGQVVGTSSTPGPMHAFLWSESTGMQDPGIPGSPRAINDSGQVVGTSPGLPNTAFLWSEGTGMQDLGKLPGVPGEHGASAINNSGQVVGGTFSPHSGLTEEEGNRAFVWSESTGIQDLNDLIPPDSGWALLSANDINESGQILCNGFHRGSDNLRHRRFCVLTPS